MARYNVFSVQRDCKRKLTTSDPSASLDLYGAMDEARRNMVKRIAPPEMVRSAYLEQAIFDNPESYAVPDDFNYDDVIELKKLSAYRNVDTLWHPFEIVFRKRYGQKRPGAKNVMNISYTNGLKTASIFHPTGLKVYYNKLVHDCDSLVDNGTWNVGGSLVNLTVDKLNKVQGKASIRFDFNNSDTEGFIENMNIDPVDLFEYLQIGATFASMSLDQPAGIQAVRMRLFSDANNYYDFTVNHPHDSNVFRSGWNVLKFLFDTRYSVGTPDAKNITGIRFDITTTGETIKDCRLDSIYTRKGDVYEATYQSAFCIIDYATGAWKHRATNGNDLLPFEDDSYQVFMLETALVLQQELYANNAASEKDVIKVKNLLEEAYTYYQMYHKSEVMEEYDTMYIFGNEYDGYQDDPMDDGYYGNTNPDANEY